MNVEALILELGWLQIHLGNSLLYTEQQLKIDNLYKYLQSSIIYRWMLICNRKMNAASVDYCIYLLAVFYINCHNRATVVTKLIMIIIQ